VPDVEFFQKLGLFAIPGFFDEEWCRRASRAMDAGQRIEGTVGLDRGPEFTVDPSYRRTKVVEVDHDLRGAVKARLIETMPAVQAHYGVPLADCQVPQFLAYRPGDFYKAHRDRNPSPTGAEFSRVRRVSAVIFVNGQVDVSRPGSYGGGALTFYEVFKEPRGLGLGVPLDAREGLLVTFPSDMLHAVGPVTHGERRTIVSWYV
jgi:predicted 2-oxoglutarate/Fe(II)-dependent dioxygenase YbiX